LLKNGEIDAFIEDTTAEAALDIFGDVDVVHFYPPIYGTVSLTTQNQANEPIIEVMQKALKHGGIYYLTELYNFGMREYQIHKLNTRLTEEERTYIKNHPTVRFLAEHDNYPISFYNNHEREFQGISHDVIKEVEALTGLSFKLINDQHTDWAEIFKMLENGQASMVTELIRTPEREGRFLWPETAVATDRHALLSKTERKNINTNEILHMRIALIEGYSHTEIFDSWFPDHGNTAVYGNFDQAFAALERGEVDLVMGSQNQLLIQTNFHGNPGYKGNLVFDYPYESTFGFHKDEVLLSSIVDKALRIINTNEIEAEWTRRTYDYRVQLAQQQFIWLISAAAALFILLLFLFVLFYLSKSKKRLEEESKFKSLFLATMSHEIRTPLNAIIGIAQIQMQADDLSSEYARSLEKIYSSGNHLLRIINDILDMSKIETGKLELDPTEYDVSNMINDTIQHNIVRIGSKPIKFILDIDETLPSRFYGDELRLKQILNNLISNAIKYTQKGQVKLSVSHKP
jgi:signal transduction histidine kinase